jgi:starvation-inducible DNA-binding protein
MNERTSPIPDGSKVTAVGYRLQLTLVDLIDLTLQTQHLRWNLVGHNELRTQLDEFDALVRAGADEVAARMRAIGTAPDGRIGTAYQDLLFDPLPSGPIEPNQAISAFIRRLAQFGARIHESLEALQQMDPRAADLLTSISEEVKRWTGEFTWPESK